MHMLKLYEKIKCEINLKLVYYPKDDVLSVPAK